MEVFLYRAMDEAGHLHRGRLPAPDLEQLESRLRRMGLDLITGRPASVTALRRLPRSITRRDLIDFCFQLEQLTGAGVPLLDGLRDLRDTTDNPRFREVLLVLVEHIEHGHSLSAATAEFPRVFDPVFVNLLRVGEQSGQLPTVLADLAESLKWQDELAARARKVMTYPVLVGLVVLGVIVFLMTYLVPQLTTFIASLEGDLPAHTRTLIATSDFVRAWWPLILGAPVVLGVVVQQAARRSPRVALRRAEIALGIPGVGELRRKLMLARVARLFALMYRAGVPVLEIVELISRVTGNPAVERALALARRQIAQGEGIARAFEATGMFPSLVIRMIAVGESTGALDKALLNVSYFYDRDVKERIGRLEVMIEPTLTVVLGLVLGWIMLSVLGPLYDLIARITP